MVTLQVQIQNLGKLADATVRVGPLTVLAGVNGTGKSYFSKALYSAFDSINGNHALTIVQSKVAVVKEAMPIFHLLVARPVPVIGEEPSERSELAAEGERSVKAMEDAVDEMAAAVRPITTATAEGEVVRRMKAPAALRQAADRMKKAYAKLEPVAQSIFASGRTAGTDGMTSAVSDLVALGGMSPDELTMAGIGIKFSDNLLRNLQSQSVSDLKREGSGSVSVNIESVGEFSAANGEDVKFAVAPSGLSMLRKRARVYFLDSPAFWRLSGPLEAAAYHPRNESSDGRMALTGIPQYFYDLFAALRYPFTGEVAFPDVSRQLTEEVIRGKIEFTDREGLVFKESGGKSYSMPRTASGVVPLGILALLIERKVLTPGAFLFIDEPESNLHPEWQVAMTEALWDLAAGGVNVVVATHSADILKRLQIYAKEEPEQAAELVAVNHFRRDGTVQSGGTEKILDVQEDLSGPFFELYKRGL